MTFTKQGPFTKKVTDLPNTPSPSYTPSDIKSYFQTPADELATTHNQLVDELEAETGAGALGALDEDGVTSTTVQARLNKGTKNLKDHKEAMELDHPDKSVTTAKLKDKAVTSGKIGDGEVKTINVDNSSITNEKLAGNITGDKIATKQIGREHVKSGAIGVDELDPNILNQPTTQFGQQAKFEQIDAQLAENANKVVNVDGLATSANTQVAFSNLIKDKRFDVSETVVISDTVNHKAFTTMIKFGNSFVLAYRKGSDHVSFDGKIVIRTSSDLLTWSAETILLESAGYDYRDPFFEVFGDKLVLKFVKRWQDVNLNECRKTNVINTTDLVTWSTSLELPFATSSSNPNGYNASRGNMTVKDGYLYTINYGLWNGTYLLRSSNLLNWEIVTKLLDDTDEASIIWYTNPSGISKFVSLFRHTTDANNRNMTWGESTDGTTWTYRKLGIKGHCPTIDIVYLAPSTRAFAVTYRDPSQLGKYLNRSFFNLAFLNEVGELVLPSYNLFYETDKFDIGYGDLVQSSGDIYISCYTSGDTFSGERILIKRISQSKITEMINGTNSDAVTKTIKYKNSIGGVSTKNILGYYAGDMDVSGDGNKTKKFTIDLTGFNLTTGAVMPTGVFCDSDIFDVRINSTTLTGINCTLICDNSVFSTVQKIRYSFTHRS